jgi:hypothetical protein
VEKKRQAVRFNWGILSAERRRRQQSGRAFLLFQPVPACGVPLRQRHDGNAPLSLRPAPHRARRSFGTCPQPCGRKLAPASDVIRDVPPGLISQMQPVAATWRLPRDFAPCVLRGCRRDCVGGLPCRFWEADARTYRASRIAQDEPSSVTQPMPMIQHHMSSSSSLQPTNTRSNLTRFKCKVQPANQTPAVLQNGIIYRSPALTHASHCRPPTRPPSQHAPRRPCPASFSHCHPCPGQVCSCSAAGPSSCSSAEH